MSMYLCSCSYSNCGICTIAIAEIAWRFKACTVAEAKQCRHLIGLLDVLIDAAFSQCPLPTVSIPNQDASRMETVLLMAVEYLYPADVIQRSK